MTTSGRPADAEPSADGFAPPGGHKMTPVERRSTAALAGLYGLRMLGLFIILPVFSVYAETLPGGSNHTLVGLALGAYGLTQSILQIPFGWASDRWGRKPLIVIGLALFAVGSAIAALAPDIHWIIVGRTLQGAGAISAAVIALLADLTRDAVRTKAMAVIGMTIGATFGLSIVLSPVLNALIGVPGIFGLTAALAAGAIWIIMRRVPDVPPRAVAAAPDRDAFRIALRDPVLRRLNFGVFALHASLMSVFIQFPLSLRAAGLPLEKHWMLYLPVMIGSLIVVAPLFGRADRREASPLVTRFSLACLAAAQAMLALAHLSTPLSLALAMFVYFAGLNVLEASLPAAVTRRAPASLRGVAAGIYSSLQFLGAFCGAAAGGWLSQHYGSSASYWFGLVATLAWLAYSATTPRPNYNDGDTRTKETPAWPR